MRPAHRSVPFSVVLHLFSSLVYILDNTVEILKALYPYILLFVFFLHTSGSESIGNDCTVSYSCTSPSYNTLYSVSSIWFYLDVKGFLFIRYILCQPLTIRKFLLFVQSPDISANKFLTFILDLKPAFRIFGNRWNQ